MAISVVMPALEMAQETGKLLVWRKREGDRVAKGEILFEVETDKSVVEIEAMADGILAGLTSREGDVVPVGETIAWIVAPGEQPPAAAQTPAASARTTTTLSRPSPPAPGQPSAQGPRISPKARRLAKERGVDITQMLGTGPDGTITTEDLLAAASKVTPPPPEPAAVPRVAALSSIARLMAERTTHSWTTVPHFYVGREVDAGALVEMHGKSKAKSETVRDIRSSLTDFLILLTARVLEKHPRMNSSWTPEGLLPNPEINISLAMAVTDGVVAAVIHRANTLELDEIARERHRLTERALAGRLHPSDLAGGTFTISNLGMFNAEFFVALVTPPQAAILAVGAITDRVVPLNGQPGIRPLMSLTLSSDHRVVDGARAALFLSELSESIREPEKWLR